MKMKVYVAGPLFSKAELEYNLKIDKILRDAGLETYLPQRDGSVAFFRIAAGEDRQTVRREVFEGDLDILRNCDFLVAILDGRSVDEGVCVEIGYAYALGKKSYGLKTDTRKLDEYGDNLIIEGCISRIFTSAEELVFKVVKL